VCAARDWKARPRLAAPQQHGTRVRAAVFALHTFSTFALAVLWPGLPAWAPPLLTAEHQLVKAPLGRAE